MKALKKKNQTWDVFLLGIAKKSRAPISSRTSVSMSEVQHDSPSVEPASLKELSEEIKRLRLYNKYLVKAYNAQSLEPECSQRIYFEGEYYCCIKAPRSVKLISLEVCRACKSRQWKLPSHKLANKEEAKKKKWEGYFKNKPEWKDPLEHEAKDNTGKAGSIFRDRNIFKG